MRTMVSPRPLASKYRPSNFPEPADEPTVPAKRMAGTIRARRCRLLMLRCSKCSRNNSESSDLVPIVHDRWGMKSNLKRSKRSAPEPAGQLNLRLPVFLQPPQLLLHQAPDPVRGHVHRRHARLERARRFLHGQLLQHTQVKHLELSRTDLALHSFERRSHQMRSEE